MPDPIREEEVNIQLTWTADSRTELAIRRQANLMGFETTAGYITQMVARALASNDEEIVITRDGRLVHKKLGSAAEKQGLGRAGFEPAKA